jgi:hypothetical protein
MSRSTHRHQAFANPWSLPKMRSQALGFRMSPASIAFNYKTERNFIVKFGELMNPEAK